MTLERPDRRTVLAQSLGLGAFFLLPEMARAQAEATGVAARVIFTGQRKDVADLTPGFDIFAMPSLTEGLSIALLEAGEPVVVYLAGAMDSWQNRERLGAVRDAGTLGLEVIVVPAGASIRSGYDAAPAALESRPTAIMAFNDLAAIGANAIGQTALGALCLWKGFGCDEK